MSRALVLVLLLSACGKGDGETADTGGDDDRPREREKEKERDTEKAKPKTRCAAFFEKLQKCESGRKVERLPDEDTFRTMCEKALDNDRLGEDMRAGVECAQRDTCDEFRTCEKALRGKKRAKSLIADLEAGRIQEAFSTCSHNPEYYADESFKAACMKTFDNVGKVTAEKDLQQMSYSCSGIGFEKTATAIPRFAKACRSLASVQLTRSLAKVGEARDAGKRDYGACSSLQSAAKMLDGNNPSESRKDGGNFAKAKEACAEMVAAENAARGIAEAKANAAAKRSQFPYQCRITLDELARIATPWAKMRGRELAKACYVELGAAVVELEVPKMRYLCPFQVREWMAQVAKHDLLVKFPELEGVMKKLPPKCLEKKPDAPP